MYTIGQFSKIARIPAKTLRYYDEIGLLKPNHVDKFTQYRYYSLNQVADIIFITTLKKYEFSLDEIKKILSNKDSKIFSDMLQNKMKEIDNQIVEMTKIKDTIKYKIEKLNDEDDILMIAPNFEVHIKNKCQSTVIFERKIIAISEIDNIVDALNSNIRENGLTIEGPEMVTFYSDEYNPDSTDVEVCIPIQKSENYKLQKIKEVLSYKCACTIFVGPYSEIGIAYGFLEQWVEENGYKLISHPYETYLVGAKDTGDVEKFVSEVCFPIGLVDTRGG